MISDGGNVTIETTDVFSRLTIRNTEGVNAGKYTVKAENTVGSDEASFDVTIIDRPSPPLNLRGTEYNKDYIVVSWDVPESDGGSAITGYKVEKKDAKRDNWVKVDDLDAKTLTVKATKLVEGNKYYFRVLAENEVGESKWTETDEPIVAKLPFGKCKRKRNNVLAMARVVI